MPAIPFPVSSAPGAHGQESGGRLINVYAEKSGEAARFPVIWRRSAGLRQLIDITTHSHLRGGILVGTKLIVVMDARVHVVSESAGAFSSTNLGALAGTLPVTCAKNNASTPNIVCVTENGAFNLFDSSPPTSFADADLPQPNSVSELHGYFFFTHGNGRISASDLNSVSVASNAYTTEQSGGGLLRGISYRDEFFAFTPDGAGVYQDAATAPFPLARQPSTLVRPGLAGTHAIAGWESGWSSGLLWAASDATARQLNGYSGDIVSNDDVSRAISKALQDGLGSSLEATVYMVGKHAFWSLTNPGVWTWEYNITTQNWNERKSYGREDWRASRAIHAFNRWIAGDRENGKLSQVDATYYREHSDPLVATMESGAIASFPSRLGAPRLDLDIMAGVGMSSGEDPIQTDPSVLISWSDDGGYSWSDPVSRKLGVEGKGDQLVTVLRTGLVKAKGRRVRLSVSDPVFFSCMGGQMAAQQRAA